MVLGMLMGEGECVSMVSLMSFGKKKVCEFCKEEIREDELTEYEPMPILLNPRKAHIFILCHRSCLMKELMELIRMNLLELKVHLPLEDWDMILKHARLIMKAVTRIMEIAGAEKELTRWR